MTHSFEKDYWERHWEQANDPASGLLNESIVNPYLSQETALLAPRTALDAGCGTGVEALWLAANGWQATGADISTTALARAAERAEASMITNVTWVEADLTTWQPERRFDLVTTNYAHPAIPQLAFYDRIAGWVAPGGTLLIVGHLQHADPSTSGHGAGHGHDGHHDESTGHDSHDHVGQPGEQPPAEAMVTLADITARLDPAGWRVDTAEEHTRTLDGPGGSTMALNDVVVRATRLT